MSVRDYCGELLLPVGGGGGGVPPFGVVDGSPVVPGVLEPGVVAPGVEPFGVVVPGVVPLGVVPGVVSGAFPELLVPGVVLLGMVPGGLDRGAVLFGDALGFGLPAGGVAVPAGGVAVLPGGPAVPPGGVAVPGFELWPADPELPELPPGAVPPDHELWASTQLPQHKTTNSNVSFVIDIKSYLEVKRPTLRGSSSNRPEESVPS